MHVEMHFVALMSLKGLVNSCWIAFYVLSGIGAVWSTHVETHILSLLAWDEFELHVLRCIFSIWLHDLGLVIAS
jgi:hypothetical protein